MDDEGNPPQAGEGRSGNDAGGTVGRDVGRDEGRDQATWRDLVARLELPAAVDPEDTPWPDRENLRTKPAPEPTEDGGTTSFFDKLAPADRSRVIRPAGPARFCGPAPEPPAEPVEPAEPGTEALCGGPRDFQLADEDNFEDEDDRYFPPDLPPQPKLDPVAKGAWIALFGGPGYLLLATLMGWQLAGWTELVSVAAFIAGFVVLVFRLGDGPSKKDGPDQGAVV
ncbi:MAG TPA: hypothetical protein VMA95_13185 [Streptosporangiaceae bacterium]|nr:hypothetical protein [Streptosporangiaceae bacterium]